VSRLLRNYNIDPRSIGRLEVGTESAIDKSKAVKTVLMSLFTDSGNHDIEGISSGSSLENLSKSNIEKFQCRSGFYKWVLWRNKCSFYAIHWLESSFWDGRYALVVCADNAVYPNGPARPTGGCGAVVLLLGPNASITILKTQIYHPWKLIREWKMQSSYMDHAYDFYKPKLDSLYPIVNGNLSISCYFKALHQQTSPKLVRKFAFRFLWWSWRFSIDTGDYDWRCSRTEERSHTRFLFPL
jgi:hydroxymethylglutaryl-CoA synthase